LIGKLGIGIGTLSLGRRSPRPKSPKSRRLNNSMNIITKLLTVQAQLRVYHWQTKSYAEHKALGNLYENLDGLIDTFVETFSGKKGGVPVAKDNFAFAADNYKDNKAVVAFLDEFIVYLTQDVPSMLDNKDTDLMNIRDEMLGEVNKTKYLLRLK
jgi:DNA-binding ferritin-like protein